MRRTMTWAAASGLAAVLAGVVPAGADHGDAFLLEPSRLWVKEPGVRLALGAGDPPGTVGFHTPYVFQAAGGTLRMYYDAFPLLVVRSATSLDGLTWTKEAGNRLVGGAHPHVLAMPNGPLRMYFEQFAPVVGVGSAVSNDGLAWTVEPGLRLPGGVDPVVLERADGSFRMYFRFVGTSNLGSAVSQNGLAWTVEPGVRLAAAAEFAAVRLPDASVLLYHAAPDFTSVRSARSADGLVFAPEPGNRLMPGAPGAADGGRVLSTAVLPVTVVGLEAPLLHMYYQASPGADVNQGAQVFSALAVPRVDGVVP